jgi:hypothetical protein
VAGPQDIEFWQLCALRSACKLEAIGMKRKGKTACQIAREKYGLKGTKKEIAQQMQVLVENAKHRRENTN